jgi:glycosyltransferase involved in cell wall biosynthesis
MQIGIDATALPPQTVGAGYYILNLVRALSRIETGLKFKIIVQPHGRELLDIPERDDFTFVEVASMSPGNRLLWEQVSLSSLVRREGVDLLHSLHYTRPLMLPVRSAVTFHDMTFFLFPHLHTRSKRVFFPQAIRTSAKKADALLAVSESTRQDAIRLLDIPPDRITTTPLGVDPAFCPTPDPIRLENVRRKYHLPEKFILYVGLIEPRKNLPLLIRAYKSMLEEGIEQKLVIVGRYGWMYDQVLDQISTLEIGESVHFTGYVERNDLPFVYNLASVFAYPTLYEGFGLPVLEAMACGVPVVTSAVSSLPEIVAEAGVLVPPQDEQALCSSVLTVLRDEVLQRRLSEAGAKRAGLFTWHKTAQATLEVYQRVLGAP